MVGVRAGKKSCPHSTPSHMVTPHAREQGNTPAGCLSPAQLTMEGKQRVGNKKIFGGHLVLSAALYYKSLKLITFFLSNSLKSVQQGLTLNYTLSFLNFI